MKKFVKLFIPEIIFIIKTKLLEKIRKSDNLFNGYSKLFKKILSQEVIYGEYGCGQSTLYVLKNFDIPIYSVESNIYWVNKIKQTTKSNNLKINFINIGNVEENSWGRPDDYSYRDNFIKYANDIWNHKLKPNVILIDGRLRVLCFLVSLKNCNPGTKIIFDDYMNRKYYHIVEEIIKPTSNDGRQCLFEVNEKNNLDLGKIDFLINKFNYVLD